MCGKCFPSRVFVFVSLSLSVCVAFLCVDFCAHPHTHFSKVRARLFQAFRFGTPSNDNDNDAKEEEDDDDDDAKNDDVDKRTSSSLPPLLRRTFLSFTRSWIFN